jgi:hypothetical protein
MIFNRSHRQKRTGRSRRSSLGLGRLSGSCGIGRLCLGRLGVGGFGFLLVILLLEGGLKLGLEVVEGVQSC